MKIDLSIPGWTLEYDLLCLAWLANEVIENGKIVEIGSFCGRSTYALLNKKSSCNITVIDNFIDMCWLFNKSLTDWPKSILGDVDKLKSLPIDKNDDKTWRKGFDHFIGEQDNLTVNCISSLSLNSLEADFAFIDGNHINDAPLYDIRLFLQNPKCLIAVDDWDVINHSDVDRCVNIAKYESNRAVYVAPNGRIAYLLPLEGPMLASSLKFIEICASIPTDYESVER